MSYRAFSFRYHDVDFSATPHGRRRRRDDEKRFLYFVNLNAIVRHIFGGEAMRKNAAI